MAQANIEADALKEVLAPLMAKDTKGNPTNGLKFHNVDFERIKGAKIALPEGMTYNEGVFWMLKKMSEEEKVVQVSERIEGFPIDVAYALQLAVAEIHGYSDLINSPGGWFPEPPTFHKIPIDAHGNTVDVFLGKFTIPGIEGWLSASGELNNALHVTGQLKRKGVPLVHQLLNKTKEFLATHSLYRGKAFRVHLEETKFGTTVGIPEFMDVTGSPRLLLNEDSMDILEAKLWNVIRNARQVREYGVDVRRGLLFVGTFGTGKTLAARVTARIAQESGSTFIYLKDVKDLKEMYMFAARYSTPDHPSVIFGEDVDIAIKDGSLNELQNVLDGVDTKNANVITVLTTNYPDDVPQSLIRPGRLGTMVFFDLPDAHTAAELVRYYGSGELDDEDFDAKLVGEAVKGQIPATIQAIIDQAKEYALRRRGPQYKGRLLIGTKDIVSAARSYTKHLDYLKRERPKPMTTMEKFGDTVGHHIVAGVVRANAGKDAPNSVKALSDMGDEPWVDGAAAQ